jgi:hypothetical protein
VKRQGPHTEVGDPSEHSGGWKEDPVSRRAAIAAKARMNPKEQFSNLLHHLTYDLIEECLHKIPRTSAVGIDGMTVDQARENLSWLLPPILQQIHKGQSFDSNKKNSPYRRGQSSASCYLEFFHRPGERASRSATAIELLGASQDDWNVSCC